MILMSYFYLTSEFEGVRRLGRRQTTFYKIVEFYEQTKKRVTSESSLFFVVVVICWVYDVYAIAYTFNNGHIEYLKSPI